MTKHAKELIVLEQDTLTKRLNAYLKWHEFPQTIRLDEAGICKGLAVVYGQYMLEGKSEQFKSLLAQASTVEKNTEHAEEINKFVFEILKAFAPSLFDPNVKQANSEDTVSIHGEPLLTKERISLVANEPICFDVFEKINLKPTEIMLISGTEHAICISRQGEDYEIYDPNYTYGPKSFKSTEVLEELKTQVFGYNDLLGLRIKVMSSDPTPRPESLNKEFYYQQVDDLNASVGKRQRDNLFFAARNNDAAAIEALLKIAKTRGIRLNGIKNAAIQAVEQNNFLAFNALFPSLEKNDAIQCLLKALQSGTLDTAQQILTKLNIKLIPSMLTLAARGGNLLLVKKVLTDSLFISPNLGSIKILFSELNDDDKESLVKHVIFHKKDDCLTYLLSQLKDLDREILIYTACYYNNPYALTYLLNEEDPRQRISNQMKHKYASQVLKENKMDLLEILINSLDEENRQEFLIRHAEEFSRAQKPLLPVIEYLPIDDNSFPEFEQSDSDSVSEELDWVMIDSELIPEITPIQAPEAPLSKMILEKNVQGYNAIYYSIKYDAFTSSISFLMDTMEAEGIVISQYDRLEYLLLALNSNKPATVNYLLSNEFTKVPKELLNHLTLHTNDLDKVNGETLKALKEAGYPFTPQMERMLDKKLLRERGIPLSIGMHLMSFVDFIILVFSKATSTMTNSSNAFFKASTMSVTVEKNEVTKDIFSSKELR